MAIRTIITEPNKLLRQISKPVNCVGKEEQKLMDDMLETMYDANGIGLAAIQVGVPKRIIEVIGPDKIENIDEDTVYFIINTLNQLNVDLIRNKLLLKVLPLKV